MYDMALEARQASEQKMSGKAVGTAAAAGSAAQPAPSAQPAPAAATRGFQPGKIYRDGQDRPARFRGYDAQGKPTFDKI
jgi:hypothetical protein